MSGDIHKLSEYSGVVVLTKAEHDALIAEAERLEDTIEFAKSRKATDARPCPLCHYMGGKLIEHCQMHADIHALKAEVARLSALVEEYATWSEEAQRVIELGLELMPLDQLRHWRGVMSTQGGYSLIGYKEATSD